MSIHAELEVDMEIEDILDDMKDGITIEQVRIRDLSKKLLEILPSTIESRECVEAFERAWALNDRRTFIDLLTELSDRIELNDY